MQVHCSILKTLKWKICCSAALVGFYLFKGTLHISNGGRHWLWKFYIYSKFKICVQKMSVGGYFYLDRNACRVLHMKGRVHFALSRSFNHTCSTSPRIVNPWQTAIKILLMLIWASFFISVLFVHKGMFFTLFDTWLWYLSSTFKINI